MSPFGYAGNNPLCFLDPTGCDSTFYVQQSSQHGSLRENLDAVKQLEPVLDQNGIPMRVEHKPYSSNIAGVEMREKDEQGVPRTLAISYRNLDLKPTDLSIQLSDDNNPALKSMR